MLGCQDFCGYYDWTFHYVRRRFGQDAVKHLWDHAIGEDSQAHYAQAARQRGLRGLWEVWNKTGEDEKCDWTWTVDESKNVLRWDMRQCPSKGFLMKNDLNTDEDYCDHCMGWMQPLLQNVGAEVVDHEHNHCGQCWGEIKVAGKPHESLVHEIDIRKDPRWNRGFFDRWKDGARLPLYESASRASDPCDVLAEWFAKAERLTILGRGPSAKEPAALALPREAVLITETTYATRDVFAGEPLAVLISDRPSHLRGTAERFHAAPPAKRPLLMHMYLPGIEPADFGSHNLPRPVPILPLLIREGLYVHQPKKPYPTTGVFLTLLSVALKKETFVAGIDLYRHPSGMKYAGAPDDGLPTWPARHSEACDLLNLRRAVSKAAKPVHLTEMLRSVLIRNAEESGAESRDSGARRT